MKKYKYDTMIPKSFVVGISEDGAGFLSMKDEAGKWTNLSVFEKHCGFKPYTQMDSVKELNKAVSQNVREIENTPTGGFKIVNLTECVYCTDHFRNSTYVRLHDPRGWDISVETKTLQSILDANGGNVKDGEIVGVKLIYCWPNRGVPFSVSIADGHCADIQKATDDFVSARDKIVTIKPAEFKVGKVYTSRTSKMAGNKYMYLGKHDVFSTDLQLTAVMRKDYSDLEERINDRMDITGVGRYVFYCLDSDRSTNGWSLTNNTPGVSPYYVTSSISKLFDREETGVDPSKFTMHNSAKPCTYDNIREDMSRSAMFNQIDFAASEKYVKVDVDAAEDVFAHLHAYDYAPSALRAFPFSCDAHGIFMQMMCKQRSWISRRDITISSYGRDEKEKCYDVVKPRMTGEWSYGYDKTVYMTYTKQQNETRKDVFARLMAETAPEVKQYVFCNGKEPMPIQNLLLNRQTKI